MTRRLLLAALLALSAAPVAAFDPGHDRARDAMRAGKVMALEQVWSAVRGQVPGRLLDARMSERRGVPVYELRVLRPDGVVVGVTADARTGQVLGARQPTRRATPNRNRPRTSAPAFR